MIRRFAPGENYGIAGMYVTSSRDQADLWESGLREPDPYALVPVMDETQKKSWVRDYVVWGWMPDPKENEFGVISP